MRHRLIREPQPDLGRQRRRDEPGVGEDEVILPVHACFSGRRIRRPNHSGWPSWSLEVEDNSGESPIQVNPNKTKQNCLDFLGFIRPNCDLSVGYAQKSKKIRFRLNSRRVARKGLLSIPRTANLYHRLPFSRRLFSNFELSTIANLLAGAPCA
jgi:hypothetical protein